MLKIFLALITPFSVRAQIICEANFDGSSLACDFTLQIFHKIVKIFGKKDNFVGYSSRQKLTKTNRWLRKILEKIERTILRQIIESADFTAE